MNWHAIDVIKAKRHIESQRDPLLYQIEPSKFEKIAKVAVWLLIGAAVVGMLMR